MVEELEGLRRALERQVLVEDHLADAEDRVRELPEARAEDARPEAERLPGRERQVRPIEVEVLPVEVAGERLVGRDRVVDVAARAADRRRQLVAEREADAESRADALPVPCRRDGPRLVRLVVEALVPVADVAEDARLLHPVGEVERPLRRRRGRLRRLVDLLDPALRRLVERALLLHLPFQAFDLVLGLAKLLFEDAKPSLLRRLRGCRSGGAEGRHEKRERRRACPIRKHAILLSSIGVPPVSPVSRARVAPSPPVVGSALRASVSGRASTALGAIEAHLLGALHLDDQAVLYHRRDGAEAETAERALDPLEGGRCLVLLVPVVLHQIT